MDVLTKLDFDKICRCCLFAQEQGLSLFNAWHLEIYHAITSLQKEDKRPKLICQQCTTKMKIIKDFAKVCIESEKKLIAIENEAKGAIKIETGSEVFEECETVFLTSIKNETENTIKYETNTSDFKEVIENRSNEIQEISCHEEPIDDKKDCITNTNENKIFNVLNSDEEPHLNKVTRAAKKRICPKKEKVERYPCDKCDKVFMYPGKLKRHKLLVHQKTKKLQNLVCEKCDKTFSYPSIFEKHKLAHLAREEKLKNSTYVRSSFDVNTCYTCKTKFATTALRNKHYEESESCKPRQFLCKVCNKSFKYNHSLKHHEISHKEDRSHSCNECNKTFKHYTSLKWHEKLHHKQTKEELKHVCTFCDKGFALACLLKLHVERHTKSGSYICETCGKHYTSKQNFRMHVYKNHRNLDNQKKEPGGDPVIRPKDFLCTFCGKSFSFKAQLKQHLNSHTGEKPHKCPHCPKTFANIPGRAAHVRIHLGLRPYKCDLCSKDFRQSAHLKAHKLSHSGAKPYQCNTCGNKFVSAVNLRLHMTIHTGDKPLKCPHCDEGFADYKARRAHVKQIHGISTSKETSHEHEDEST